jgi:hypothetical protein
MCFGNTCIGCGGDLRLAFMEKMYERETWRYKKHIHPTSYTQSAET